MKNQIFSLFLSFSLLVSTSMAQGTMFEWVKGIGGAQKDVGRFMTMDASENIYITGYFEGTVDFDPGTGVKKLTAIGYRDAFVCKYNSQGELQWAKQFGGQFEEVGHSLAIDSQGNVFVTGQFSDKVDFDPGSGTKNINSKGFTDAFIVKLNNNGSLVWAHGFGAAHNDEGSTVNIDPSGNVIIAGTFADSVDFDFGTGVFPMLAPPNSWDIYLLKLKSDGSFIWAKEINGIGGGEFVDAMTTDASGNIYYTGWIFYSADFDPGPNTFNLYGTDAMFISKLNNNGSFVWAGLFSEGISVDATSIAVDGSGNVYTTGYFKGKVDFDPGPGKQIINTITNSFDEEIFVSKLDPGGDFVWAKQIGGKEDDRSMSVDLDASGNVYTTGYFQDTADFDPGNGTFVLVSDGAEDAFVSKLDASGNFVWASQLRGKQYCEGRSLKLNSSDKVILMGNFDDVVDFDPGTDSSFITSTGNRDIFIQQLGQLPVGISETVQYQELKTYPNPTSTLLYLSRYMNDSEVHIYSAFGQQIFSIDMVGNSIDVSGLNPGLYFGRITTRNGEFLAFRFVKE